MSEILVKKIKCSFCEKEANMLKNDEGKIGIFCPHCECKTPFVPEEGVPYLLECWYYTGGPYGED